MSTRTSFLLVSTLIVLLDVASATAGIRHVENNGVDGSACGDTAKPCRSISRAVQNAQPGDTILVGPGLYGDINRDKDFLDPGDEAAEPVGGRFCVLCIGKRVRILSTNGANATRIESTTELFDNMESQLVSLVLIATDGVTFGTPGHGFELTGEPSFLLNVSGHGDIAIGGNVARRTEPRDRDLELLSQIGFLISAEGAAVYATGNTAINNHFGFVTRGSATTVLSGNYAVNNSWEGFQVSGAGVKRLFGNFASGNGGGRPTSVQGQVFTPLATGFNVSAGATSDILLEDNLSVANLGPGFLLTNLSTTPNTVLRVKHNSATGNSGAGVTLAPGGPADVRTNNIFGNLGAGSGCGLINETGKRIDATRNFWGAPTGPGADPADKAGPGSGCDQGQGSVTVVTPFATGAVPVAP